MRNSASFHLSPVQYTDHQKCRLLHHQNRSYEEEEHHHEEHEEEEENDDYSLSYIVAMGSHYCSMLNQMQEESSDNGSTTNLNINPATHPNKKRKPAGEDDGRKRKSNHGVQTSPFHFLSNQTPVQNSTTAQNDPDGADSSSIEVPIPNRSFYSFENHSDHDLDKNPSSSIFEWYKNPNFQTERSSELHELTGTGGIPGNKTPEGTSATGEFTEILASEGNCAQPAVKASIAAGEGKEAKKNGKGGCGQRLKSEEDDFHVVNWPEEVLMATDRFGLDV